MTDMATMAISYPLPDGETGLDDDPQNPLARALAPLMEMDKQLPSIRLAFLAERQNAPPTRWLGVFVRSPGDRVLFVPGLDVDLFRVRGTEGGVARFDKEFDLDHVSLEKHRGSWHVTSPRSKAHQGDRPRSTSGMAACSGSAWLSVTSRSCARPSSGLTPRSASRTRRSSTS